ncbi:helix-turn-helix domain-containing protein [Elioraea thermophila]|uniref:helix-turn-helix domain-containing protein n=1 Tax=Elioraea thermophila TaxID=2185104 RepID=UPI0013005053
MALTAIYDCGTPSEAARLGCVTVQVVQDWVLRCDVQGPSGLIDHKAPGPGRRCPIRKPLSNARNGHETRSGEVAREPTSSQTKVRVRRKSKNFAEVSGGKRWYRCGSRCAQKRTIG